MNHDTRPAVVQSTLVVILLTALWVYVRLFLFAESLLPLTFVLPLLIGVWTGRKWHIWSMASVFALATGIKYFSNSSADVPNGLPDALFYGSTLFNIGVGSLVVHLIIAMRARIAAQMDRIVTQNSELEAQGEELAQQNEEMKVQSEELAQQNEEIESQGEELTGQNEELQEANERLKQREEILQGMLESARTPETGRHALAEVCRRALPIVGKPVATIAILTLNDAVLKLQVQAGVNGNAPLPDEWPVHGSIGGVVLAKDQTAYVSDLRKEPRYAAPFALTAEVQSVLATPLRVAGVLQGVVVACSEQEGHWTQEQFRVLEWVAAQCGLIAESLRWQDELSRRADEIAAANRAKDQFLAMLSHELRTPLTPVLAAVGELEQDGRLPSDVRDDLGMIRRNVTIQSRLIDDLLDLTKLERGKIDLDRELLDMAKLLVETAAIVAPDVEAKAQHVSLELNGAEGCIVNGDGARLQQVFWNLLKNAIKFSPAAGRITVTAQVILEASPLLRIQVTDSGVGIGPENLDRIFLPFEQAMAGGKQRNGDAGLGLGLAIAKAIVELHHGRIRADSPGVGHGATFSVELPLAKPFAPNLAPSLERPTQDRKLDRSSIRLLLVEDHGDTGRVLSRLLRNAGYQVAHSDTGLGALGLATTQPFDLVVSDLGLPDMSGLEFMPKLRAQQPALRGICISGYGMDEDLKACHSAGFAEHLTKPVDLQRLHAAIARVSHVAAAAFSDRPAAPLLPNEA